MGFLLWVLYALMCAVFKSMRPRWMNGEKKYTKGAKKMECKRKYIKIPRGWYDHAREMGSVARMEFLDCITSAMFCGKMIECKAKASRRAINLIAPYLAYYCKRDAE